MAQKLIPTSEDFETLVDENLLELNISYDEVKIITEQRLKKIVKLECKGCSFEIYKKINLRYIFLVEMVDGDSPGVTLTSDDGVRCPYYNVGFCKLWESAQKNTFNGRLSNRFM